MSNTNNQTDPKNSTAEKTITILDKKEQLTSFNDRRDTESGSDNSSEPGSDFRSIAHTHMHQLFKEKEEFDKKIIEMEKQLKEMRIIADKKQNEIDKLKELLFVKPSKNSSPKEKTVCKYGSKCKAYLARKEWKNNMTGEAPEKCKFVHKNSSFKKEQKNPVKCHNTEKTNISSNSSSSPVETRPCKYGEACKFKNTTCKYQH